MKKTFWKALGIFLLASLVLSLSAVAASSVRTTPIKNDITVLEQATFQLHITNQGARTQRYSIYSLQSGQGWAVDPVPLKDRIIEINSGQTYVTTIQAAPLEDFSSGIYYVQVTVENDAGERFTEQLKIYLRPEKPAQYLPTIRVTLDMLEKIDPREAVSVKLLLENRNPLDLAGLKLKLHSEMPEFSKEISVELPSLDKKAVEMTLQPNPFQEPGIYTLLFAFEHEGQTVKVLEKKVEILPQQPSFVQQVQEHQAFLKKTITLKVTNPGNVKNTQEVRFPLKLWAALFTQTEGKMVVREGERVAVWQLSLGPNESEMLMLVTNYRWLVYVALVVAAFLLFYFAVQSPVIISKKAMVTKSDDEGAVSELKVTLEIRNRANRSFHNLHIMDTVPLIAHLEKSIEPGTLKPQEVIHTPHGAKVKWLLAEVEGHEQRLITYTVKAKLNILGEVQLPRAEVWYPGRSGRQRKAYSSPARLAIPARK